MVNILRKKISLAIITGVLTGLGMMSCTSYLDVDPKTSGQLLGPSYYQDSTQCYAALAAAYSGVRINSGGFYCQLMSLNPASDDHYAGGGGATDGGGLQNVSNWTLTASSVGDNTNGPTYMWYNYYIGITNSNILLSHINGATMSTGLKARMTAECKALRAFYYFNLVRVWGHIPLLLEPVSAGSLYDVLQSTPVAVYNQIEKDLTDAIPDLPALLSSAEVGRFSQGAATALLGKVYLFEGDGVPRGKNPGGTAALPGDASKYALAAAELAKVNGPLSGSTFSSPYGYKLLTNYADLWSNKMTNASPLFSNSPGRFNSESILEDVHSMQGLSGWGNAYSGSDMGNSMNNCIGPRSYSVVDATKAPNLSTLGNWSFDVITPDAFNFMQSYTTGTDSRMAATVLNMTQLVAEGAATYTGGYHDTGYFLYKFQPLKSDETTMGGDAVLNYQQDTYIIRLADTYLMEAEALLKSNGDQARSLALVNAIRTRAGATPLTSLTLQNIYNERRMELMGEGHRYFDLVRTGQAATVLATKGFTANKNEYFPIPFKEMQNQNFKQNYGY